MTFLNTLSNDGPAILIAGPCQLEEASATLRMAERIAAIAARLNLPFVFKASYDKANRTSITGQRGPGRDAGLEILAQVRDRIGCPLLTDVHHPEDCAPVAEVVDILQIPAFLCRQTDLLVAAGRTGRKVNIKKGQFLAPGDMQHVAHKVAQTGNTGILLTERGTSFGYHTLVVDMRAIPIMKQTGYPVIMDATHAVQQPGGLGSASGGQREFVPTLARAAMVQGIAGLFLETHPDPDHAPSDGPNMIPLDRLEPLLRELKALDDWVKSREPDAP